MSEESKVEAAAEDTDKTVEETATETGTAAEAAPKKKGRKKWPIVVGVIAVVVIAAGAGFWVWHEQPSFCNAICHTPMDEYVESYVNSDPNGKGIDKYGNEVSHAKSMLAVSHKIPKADGGAETDCLGCHVPTIQEQLMEGVNWVTGNYEYPLYERTTADLTEARGVEADTFCLNESCHNVTRQDLLATTSDLKRNPHQPQHNELECGQCHKAHSPSEVYCSQCHQGDTEIPEGWLSAQDAAKLKNSK